MLYKRFLLFTVLAFSFFCMSCLSLKADIQIQADGSGTLVLDYRVSKVVNALSRMEGAAPYVPLPADRISLERLIAVDAGLSLVRYAQEEDEIDTSISARIAFENLEALVALGAQSGRSIRYEQEDGTSSLRFRVSEGGGPLDPDLRTLVQTLFKGYNLDITVQPPKAPIPSSPGALDASGQRILFSETMENLLASEKEILWTVSWRD